MKLNADISTQSTDGQWSPGLMLQRKCDCGNHAMSGSCNDCARKKSSLNRKSTSDISSSEAPSIVHEVLRSNGQPLDASTRAFMEPRFGHDFSHVRLHTDAKAEESARSVNALAYTVGHNIVLGDGAKSSNPWEQRKTLAHELTHVIQQSQSPRLSRLPLTIGSENHDSEREAERTADRVMTSQSIAPLSSMRVASTGAGVIRRTPTSGCTAAVTGSNNADDLIDAARRDAVSRVSTATAQARAPSSRTLRQLDWHFHCPGVPQVVEIANVLSRIAAALPAMPVTCAASSAPRCASRAASHLSGPGLEVCPNFFRTSDEERSAELIAAGAWLDGHTTICLRREACYDDFTTPATATVNSAYSYAYFALEASGFSGLRQPSVIPCRPTQTGINVIVPADAASNPSGIRRLTGFEERPPRGAEIVPVYEDRSGKYFIYRSGLPDSQVYMPGEHERYYLPRMP
jgi:hypothetical protein